MYETLKLCNKKTDNDDTETHLASFFHRIKFHDTSCTCLRREMKKRQASGPIDLYKKHIK